MSNPEFEYHKIVDVINEAARQGDVTNVLRLGDLADVIHEQAIRQGYLPASNYREGVATATLLESEPTLNN